MSWLGEQRFTGFNLFIPQSVEIENFIQGLDWRVLGSTGADSGQFSLLFKIYHSTYGINNWCPVAFSVHEEWASKCLLSGHIVVLILNSVLCAKFLLNLSFPFNTGSKQPSKSPGQYFVRNKQQIATRKTNPWAWNEDIFVVWRLATCYIWQFQVSFNKMST